MSEEQAYYETVGQGVEGSVQSQMFGKPCYKINKKAFVCFFEQDMVFKLQGDDHTAALELEGAKLFDPSGKGRAMKEWVQVPYTHHNEWPKLSQSAAEYVGGK